MPGMAELEIKRISPKMEKEEQRARAAIMQLPAIRQIMGGDIHLLDVAPSPTGQEVTHELGLDRADSLQKPPRGKRGSKLNDAAYDLEQTDASGIALQIPEELQSSSGPNIGETCTTIPDVPPAESETTADHADGTSDRGDTPASDVDGEDDDFDDIPQY